MGVGHNMNKIVILFMSEYFLTPTHTRGPCFLSLGMSISNYQASSAKQERIVSLRAHARSVVMKIATITSTV